MAFERVRKFYANLGIYLGNRFPYISSPLERGPMTKRVTSNLVEYLVQLSDFTRFREEEVYEQLYIWEPEVGGAIDRISTMAGQAYQGIFLDYDDASEVTDADRKALKIAKAIDKEVRYKNFFESFTEILMTQGNIYLIPDGKLSFQIMPNRYITFVEDDSQLNVVSLQIISVPKKMVYQERLAVTRQVYTNFSHIKWKDTPIFAKDFLGRMTYGVYSVSPLQRTILPIWWSRQTMIIDILVRWKNVPREHHTIDANLFSLDKYEGSISERREAARKDAQKYLDNYTDSMKHQVPDQGYVTLDTQDIKMIQQERGSSQYMQTNELLEQIQKRIWTALNVPQSFVNGTSAGSYASDLVVSNYVEAKIIQVTEKIRPFLLDNLRKRVLAVDPTLPVDKLDMKLKLTIAASSLELYRQASIMGALDIFTDDEIRELVGYEELSEEQKKEILKTIYARAQANQVQPRGPPPGSKSVNQVLHDASSTEGPVPPETPQSNKQHKQDEGRQAVRAAEHP